MVVSDKVSLKKELDAHIAQATGAHAASAIANTPSGNITSTTVQAAIDELDMNAPGQATTMLIIENRTDDPVAPATGRIWLRTDL
jgi:hypothetical protein